MAYYQKRPETEHNGLVNLVILGALVVFGIVLFNSVASFFSSQPDLTFLRTLAGPPRLAGIAERLEAEPVNVPRPISSDEMAAISPVGVIRGYAFCQTGEVPTFRHGFERLRAAVGVEMGEPLECEHATGPSTTAQRTTTGTATYDAATNTSSFATTASVWRLGSEGLSVTEAPAS